MLLIPAGLFPGTNDPKVEKVSQLDEQMKEILGRKDVDERTKATMYSQILQQYLNLKRKLDAPRTVPVVKKRRESTSENSSNTTAKPSTVGSPAPTSSSAKATDPLATTVLENLPKKYRVNATTLLQEIEKSPNVSFNDRGELLIRGKPVRCSHAVDLIDDVVRPPTKGRVPAGSPVGWFEFAKALKDMNVPRLLIGNTKRWEHMQLLPSSVPITPPSSRTKPTTTLITAPATPQPSRSLTPPPIPRYKMPSSPQWEAFK